MRNLRLRWPVLRVYYENGDFAGIWFQWPLYRSYTFKDIIKINDDLNDRFRDWGLNMLGITFSDVTPRDPKKLLWIEDDATTGDTNGS